MTLFPKRRHRNMLTLKNFLILVAAIGCVLADVSHTADYDPHPQYAYAYDVQDPHTGDYKSQHETRSGDVVQGSYSLVDPDGTKRTVDYTADPVNGFNAVVKKEPIVGGVVQPVVVAAVTKPEAIQQPGVVPAPVPVATFKDPIAYSPYQAYQHQPYVAYPSQYYSNYALPPLGYPVAAYTAPGYNYNAIPYQPTRYVTTVYQAPLPYPYDYFSSFYKK